MASDLTASSSNAPVSSSDTLETQNDVEVNGDAAQETQDTTQPMVLDQPANTANIENVLPESRIPSKKDATLREFLSKMDDHAPIVHLSSHHLF